MALREDEPKHTLQILLKVGIPSFLLAVILSTITHQLAHLGAAKLTVPSTIDIMANDGNLDTIHSGHPFASAAGPIWTFFLALVSFGFFLRYPRNLFAASMAFVNASSRVTETISVFFQLLFHNKTTMIVDESLSLALIPLKDPTISIVMMCFFSIITLYLTIIVVHDLKTVPWKWLVALVLFVILGPLENIIWIIAEPLVL